MAIFQQYHRELDINAMPRLLMPKIGSLGLTNYEKMFCVNQKLGNIYKMRGLNMDLGCMVIIRPDQHVANVLPMNGFKELSEFFDDFLIKPVDNDP